MSENRVTSWVDRRMMNRTEKVFPDETKLLLTCTNFMRRITRVAKLATTKFDEKPNLRAVMDLFARNRDIVHFSLVCLYNGGYPEAKILSRVALENFLLIRLFNLRPELARDWLSDPDFYKKWRPKAVRKEVFPQTPTRLKAYGSFYWNLCNYAHPSFKGWAELMKRNKVGVYIRWRPIFNHSYASECMGLIFWAIIQSVKGFVDAFNEWLKEDLIKEANRLMPKVHEMVTRHFEYREYDKKQLYKN